MSSLVIAYEKAAEKADRYDDIYWPPEKVEYEVNRLLGNSPYKEFDLDDCMEILDHLNAEDTKSLTKLFDSYRGH